MLTEAHDRDPDSMETPHIQELIKIDQQNLGIICDAIDIGKKDGSIREDINTFLTALYLVKSTLNIFSSSLSTVYDLGLFGMSKEDFNENSFDQMISSRL